MISLFKLSTISPFGIDGNMWENWSSPKNLQLQNFTKLALSKFSKFKTFRSLYFNYVSLYFLITLHNFPFHYSFSCYITPPIIYLSLPCLYIHLFIFYTIFLTFLPLFDINDKGVKTYLQDTIVLPILYVEFETLDI